MDNRLQESKQVIVVARHASYDVVTGALTRHGRHQAGALSEGLRPHLPRRRSQVTLLHSPTLRAAETAKVLGESFGISPHACGDLAIGSGLAVGSRLSGLPAVIAVSHEDVVLALLGLLAPEWAVYATVPRASAWVLTRRAGVLAALLVESKA